MKLNHKRACVRVEHREGKLVVLPGVYLLEAGINLMPVEIPVVGEDGEPVEPAGRFMITAETIDPYHLVTDLF